MRLVPSAEAPAATLAAAKQLAETKNRPGEHSRPHYQCQQAAAVVDADLAAEMERQQMPHLQKAEMLHDCEEQQQRQQRSDQQSEELRPGEGSTLTQIKGVEANIDDLQVRLCSNFWLDCFVTWCSNCSGPLAAHGCLYLC